MLKVGQFVEVTPQGRKTRPQVGVIVGVNLDKSGKCRTAKIYVHSHRLVVGVPPTSVKALPYTAKKEGDFLVTGKGLKISLKTGYPV